MKRPRNSCRLPGYQDHDYKDCRYNRNNNRFCGVVHTLADYYFDGKLKESTKKREKVKENNKIEKEVADDDKSDYSSESDSCEFHMVSKDVKSEEKTFSAEILVSIPNGINSRRYTTYRGLADTGSSESLANSKFVGPHCRTKKNTKPTNWITEYGTFNTTYEGIVESVKLPQFTTNRSYVASFHFLSLGTQISTLSSLVGTYFEEWV